MGRENVIMSKKAKFDFTSIDCNQFLDVVINPLNRSQRRKSDREKYKLSKLVLLLEIRFYRDLFKSGFENYHLIRSYYLDWYKIVCDYVQKVIKPEYYKVREMYFCELTKPVM